MKNFIKYYIIPLLIALGLLVVVQRFFITQYTSSGALVEWGIEPNDRILVNRWAYRSSSPPERGDRVVFHHPYMPEKPICFATCKALPGDTLWYDTELNTFALQSQVKTAVPIVVPEKGVDIEVTPYNARLLWHLLKLEKAFVTYRANGELLINGKRVKHVAFLNDYFWLSTHATTYGLIPLNAILGAPLCISFGMKEGSLRFDRLFLTFE
ncbi:MAG: S26 family signal peptidase [Bacteroidaceae bacterium]|nr:S26 family signal peptidase [Bacteroidaceae bacterium]